MSSPFRRHHIVLLAILTAGTVLRFYGLTSRGIANWDGFLYANIAKTPIYAWDYLVSNYENLSLTGLKDFLEAKGASFTGIKPVHTFIIFLSFSHTL